MLCVLQRFYLHDSGPVHRECWCVGVLRSPTSDPAITLAGHFDVGPGMAAYRTADRDSLEILN